MFRKGASKDKVKKKGDGGGKPKPQTPPPAGDDKPAVSNMKTMLPIVSQIDGARPREKMTDKLAAKVKRCVRGKMMPDHLTDRVTVDVQWETNDQLGLLIKEDLVVHVFPGSVMQCHLHSGDILVQCNDFHFTENLQNNTGFLKALTKKGKKTARFEVIRLKRKVPVDWSLLPGFTKQEGMEYHQVYLYNYKGMQVGLDVRMIEDPEMNRVFVERVRDKSAAAVCLGFGDRIIEHSGRMVTNVQDLLSALQTELNEKGWTRMTVEVPVSDPCRCFVRNKLLNPFGLPTEGGMPPEIEPGLSDDAVHLATKLHRWWNEEKRKPLAPILVETPGTAKKTESVKIADKAKLHPVPIDDSIRLLTRTPMTNKFDSATGAIVKNFRVSEDVTSFPKENTSIKAINAPRRGLSVMPSFLQTARNPVKSTMQPTKKG
ncbi:unnamed protein product, partial [Mesorhabditis spiculigera]